MRVLADEDLSGIEALVEKGFDLTLLPGREIDSASLKGQDALLVRSITRVDRKLLAGSDIAFVGTATSGVDHIDQDYLASHGIRLAHAAGSNAEAVVDYCLAAMALMGEFARPVPPVVGIIGVGQVGGRLYRRLSAMGLPTKLCDPPLAASLADIRANEAAGLFSPLTELTDCDVVSLHVPLTSAGEHPTQGVIADAFLRQMSPDALLIHTARGGVVDETALRTRFEIHQAPRCVFDVWQGEPAVDPVLVAAVDVATPHIAGYSRRAKALATGMVIGQLEAFASGVHAATESSAEAWPARHYETGSYPTNAGALVGTMQTTFDLAKLSTRFKQAVSQSAGGVVTPGVFDGFRRELRERTEFGEVSVPDGLTEPESRFLRGAGFSVDPAR